MLCLFLKHSAKEGISRAEPANKSSRNWAEEKIDKKEREECCLCSPTVEYNMVPAYESTSSGASCCSGESSMKNDEIKHYS